MPNQGGKPGFKHAEPVVREAVLIAAPPEPVWQAWTDTDRVAEWFADRARGDARPGATVTWFFDRFKASIDYEVLEAEPPRHLVMRAQSPDGRAYLQEIGLEPVEDGTRVTVTCSGGGRDEEDTQGIVSGWQISLAILKHYIENHFGEPRRSFFAMQPAPVDYPRVRRFFTEEWHLSRWLTTRGTLAEPGEPYRLELRGGDTMSGTVLAVTTHEVALSWEEINGFVELKAFRLGAPGERAVCLRGSGWIMSDEMRLETERMAQAFIGKLVAALKEPTQPRSGNGHGDHH